MTMSAGDAALRALDDDELMLRVQRDDADAFRVLYERHATRALCAARSIGAERAEDAVQDGFISVWRGRARYRPCGASVGAWIVTIVRRRALDLARAAARERETSDDGPEDSIAAPGSVEEDAIARDDGELLRDALKALPPIQREVIVLAFFGGLTHRQIASRLRLAEGTVKGRMRLGLNKLRGASDGWRSPAHHAAGTREPRLGPKSADKQGNPRISQPVDSEPGAWQFAGIFPSIAP